ncbi:MAG: hypothetical protein EXR71_04600 [Myxococcales bacterium]|nr:hypothetical protein [Myxococcales bacterium]
MILIGTVVAALAGEPAILVLPASGGPAESVVRKSIAAAGLDADRVVGASAFTAGVLHVGMPRTMGRDCIESISLPEWRQRLADAQRRFERFDAEGAVSELVLLELELECLTDPVPARDLVALDLARAEAHLLLAASAPGGVDGQGEFHAEQAAAALDRAVVSAPGRQPDVASPELLEGLVAARLRRRDAAPTLVLVGLGSDEEAWVNGRVVEAGGELPVGDSVIQRVTGARVVAALRVQIRAEQVVVLDFSGDDTALAEVVAGLVRRVPGRHTQALLGALAVLRGDGEVVVYVGWDRAEPVAWQARGDDLFRLEPPGGGRPAPGSAVAGDATGVGRADDRASAAGWRATAGVQLGAGWRNEGQGIGLLDVGLAGRVAVGDRWSVAWAVVPGGLTDTLDPGGDGVTVEVPVRLGARYGQRGGGWSPEGGLDLGVRFGDRAAPLLGGCAGAARPMGPAGGVRLEGCVETDFGSVGLRGALVVESWI